MNKKTLLQFFLLLTACFLVGCGVAAGLWLYDAHADAVTPISGGQTIDFSEYGFMLTVPDGYSLADYTTNHLAEGGSARFAGCLFEGDAELYLYCYTNESGDNLADYSERELVSYYMQAGAQEVRLRSLGGRRFLEYAALVQNGSAIERWTTYETWDHTRQISFETRMPADEVLPILATIAFTD